MNYFKKLAWKIDADICYPIRCHMARKKKTHYQCKVCGLIEAPYFQEEYGCGSITDDYGWNRIGKKKHNLWICHHCCGHGFSDSNTKVPREKRDPTWDEWQEFVKMNNEKILSLIQKKDPDYYEYWFNGGYEEELFKDLLRNDDDDEEEDEE